MPDNTQIDWSGLSGAKPSATPAQSGGIDWSGLSATKPAEQQTVVAQPAQETKPQKTEEVDPGFFFRNIIKTAHGPSISNLYDKLVNILPDEYKGGFAQKLAVHLVRSAPELADTISSPFGMAMTAAHVIPALRPAAYLADIGMGAYQAYKTVPST